MNERHAIDAEERRQLWREATTMVLYVAVVLLAALAALPAGPGADGHGPTQGPTGGELIGLVWGTTIGLALAHWFAFHVAAQGLGGGHLGGEDLREALAEVTGAASVAVAATVPVLLFSTEAEQRIVLFVLALVIGVVSYLVERANGRSRAASLLFGAITLVVGLVVAGAKYQLSAH